MDDGGHRTLCQELPIPSFAFAQSNEERVGELRHSGAFNRRHLLPLADDDRISVYHQLDARCLITISSGSLFLLIWTATMFSISLTFNDKIPSKRLRGSERRDKLETWGLGVACGWPIQVSR